MTLVWRWPEWHAGVCGAVPHPNPLPPGEGIIQGGGIFMRGNGWLLVAARGSAAPVTAAVSATG